MSTPDSWLEFTIQLVFRIIVLVISLPFGGLVALIPAYAVGEVLGVTGVPKEWIMITLGWIGAALFATYIQRNCFGKFQLPCKQN